jgi:hypothetical protein
MKNELATQKMNRMKITSGALVGFHEFLSTTLTGIL